MLFVCMPPRMQARRMVSVTYHVTLCFSFFLWISVAGSHSWQKVNSMNCKLELDFHNLFVSTTSCCNFISMFFMFKLCTNFFIKFGFIPNFLASEDMNFNQSSHATFKMGECEDKHIPTCMLDNKANLLSHSMPPTPHGSAWPKIGLRILAKASPKYANSILLHQNGSYMKLCTLSI